MTEDPSADIHSDGLARIGSYTDESLAYEHALVILAMGHECWIDRSDNDHAYSLHAPQSQVQEIACELNAYDEESEQLRQVPKIEPSPFAYSAGWGLYALWLTTLVIILYYQPFYPWLVEQGASSSVRLIEHHEWWRPFTALFLHADGNHLLGNLLSALFFATLVCKSIGPVKGWALILGCGTLGNLATSLSVWPDAYRSIGASTATFAALGILSGLGFAWMLKHRLQLPWLRMIAPVIAGIIVLGMTGSGLPTDNTDVLGHVYGFAAGTIAGIIYGSLTETLKHTSNSETSKAESGEPT